MDTTAAPPRFATLMLLTGLSVLSLNMVLPSLPGIAVEFGADYALVSLSVSGYLAMTAVLQLFIGPLSDRYGRRPVLLWCVAGFTVASLGCALAEDIWLFLACRILQGAIISGYTLSLAVIRDTMSERMAASRIGYVSMAMAVAPMVGPLIGGGLDQALGWRAGFAALCGLGLVAFAISWADLGETNLRRSRHLLSQMRSYPELIRSRRFWGYALCMAFSTGAFYSFLAGAPLVAKTSFGMEPAAVGFWIGTITGGFMLGSFLSGRYASRVDVITMMIAGRIVACAGLFCGLALVLAGTVSPTLFFGSTLFLGIGNGLTFPSASSGALSVRSSLIGSASGLSGALSVGGGALLMTATGAALDEENAAPTVLAMMLLCAVFGLIAAMSIRRLDAKA